MRLAIYQQTLAISMAGVLFSGGMARATTNITYMPNLAWQLYQEGDWHHTHIEARRQQTATGETDPIFGRAIAKLAAWQQAPGNNDLRKELEAWLETQQDHPQHNWVAMEVAAIQTRQTTTKPRLTGRIARRAIGFYRNQIAPAIGQRCAMHPSCSHYSLEACQRYGLAGIPMTADRLIRESDHIRYRINPIASGDRELYHDPVSDHSHWFRRYRK